MADRIKTEEILRSKFGSAILETGSGSDILSLTVARDSLFDIISFLRNDPEMDFGFLTTLCGIHYPESELPLGVIYHLHNLAGNSRIRIKTFLPVSSPEVRSVTPLFKAANWMERETYDFYGIVFTGHPNLKRILNVEYLDFFPMRKEIPLEDPTREDKEDRFFGR
ncbi:MAG TPA: NADH-quinone oxidoreductase subunit C [Bacteroidales bacterium]|nr:NADH-quinone oxidoreductase subunit C [Bacteroidales bacterium]